MDTADFLRWAARFPEALMFVSGEGTILAANSALFGLTGTAQPTLVGKSLLDWAKDPAKGEAALRLWNSSGQMIPGPTHFTANGTTLRCEGAVVIPATVAADARLLVRVRHQQTSTERFLALNRKIEQLNAEIRERRRSEIEARDEKERFHVTLGSIGDAVVATDIAGRVEFLNGVAEHLTGWSLADASGKPLGEVMQLFDEETGKPTENPVERVLRHGDVVQLANHTVLRSRDGLERPIEDSAAPIRNAEGQVMGVVLVFQDVTLEHRDRAALKDAHDAAIAASKAKDRFLAVLSHELRTPLSPIMLLASEGAQNQNYSPQVRSDFEIIAANAALEARLVDDLLDLTRISHGKMALAIKTVEVESLLRQALDSMRRDIAEKQLVLELDFAANAISIPGDAARLQQVFWNLLKNAIKFTPARGRIRIATRHDQETVTLSFQDTGIGMSPAELMRIFHVFAQGDHATSAQSHRFGGLGLGLAISRTLVEMHEGTISARSEGVGTGSTFTVVLPRRHLTAVSKTAHSQARVGDERASRSRHLLLVEDHAPTRNALVRLLGTRNFKLTAVDTVAKALEAAAHENFDLVVSDIGLPDGDGFELMRELRRRHTLQGLAISGYGMDVDLQRSREAGFVFHLTKPLNVELLDTTLVSISRLLKWDES